MKLRTKYIFLFSIFLLLMISGCNKGSKDVFFSSPDVIVSFEPSVVVRWNEVMLAAIRNSSPRPTVVARSQFMVHSAIYDAWTAYHPIAVPTELVITKRPVQEQTDANKSEAISQAAYQMLITLFPSYETNTGAFSTLLNELGYAPVLSGDSVTPSGIGFSATEAVLGARLNDGSNSAGNFADTTSTIYPTLYAPANSADPLAPNAPGGIAFDPNRWQPLQVPTGTLVDSSGTPIIDPLDPTTFNNQTFLTPHWGAVTPFALTSGSQFRPQAPPQAGSSSPYTDALGNTSTNDIAYINQIDEVLTISANLTDAQKAIAEYWADGPRSETPPGHWNAISHGISYRDRHGIDEDVKLYFALNGALLDSSIAAWEAKRFYDFVRPISAIRDRYFGVPISAWGGPNQGTQIISGETWQPYQSLTFVTPPFAEYVSGHSTFSAASAEILTRFSGSSTFYDGVTVLNDDFNNDGVFDMLGEHIVGVNGNTFENSPSTIVILRWNTFQEAADEAGISRLYGGIHFQDGDRFARMMGTSIGSQAFNLAESYWNGTVTP